MNKKFKELYFRDDVIIGSKQNFIIAKKTLNASTKEINEFMTNQEINQINKKPTKHMNLKQNLSKSTWFIILLVRVSKIYY